MKSYKPLFLFMLSLSLISIAAKAEDAAKPPPPSDQEIADQKNYEELMKHFRPIASVDELKKSGLDFTALGGQGKMGIEADGNDCPKSLQLKVFGPFAKMTIQPSQGSETNIIITQDNLKLPEKLQDYPDKFLFLAKDDQGRLVIITQDDISYLTLSSSSALLQSVDDSEAQIYFDKGMLPVPKAGSGCILSLENSKSDTSIKSGQVAAKLPGRHLAVIDDDALIPGLNHDGH